MSDEYFLKAKDYRTRAADLRAIAKNIAEPSRRVLLLCADDYERIAETIENIIIHDRDHVGVQ